MKFENSKEIIMAFKIDGLIHSGVISSMGSYFISVAFHGHNQSFHSHVDTNYIDIYGLCNNVFMFEHFESHIWKIHGPLFNNVPVV